MSGNSDPAVVKQEAEEMKKPWASWTLWASLITALAPAFPPVAVFLAANPEVLSAVGIVFGALRLKTSGPVQVKKAK